MTSRTKYVSPGCGAILSVGQIVFVDEKRHVVREVFADTFTLELDTRNHQTRRVDRAKARAAAKAKREAS